MGQQVEETDTVQVGKKILQGKQTQKVLAFYKPVGVTCTEDVYKRQDEVFDWKEGDARERRFLRYSFLDDDHMQEYIQTGYASDKDTMIPTGREYNRSKEMQQCDRENKRE